MDMKIRAESKGLLTQHKELDTSKSLDCGNRGPPGFLMKCYMNGKMEMTPYIHVLLGRLAGSFS